MKVYILADAEGITGVVNHSLQVMPDSPGYGETRALLMSDLNAAVDGAVEAGAEEITVYDMHVKGLNVILDALHPPAAAVLGKPPKVKGTAGIDDSYDALLMVGYHAMSGTPGALMPHTYTLDMKALRLNGVLMGEIGLEAALAGCAGVPLVMVSGDEAAMEETRTLLGDAEEAVVKKAAGESGALCLPPRETRALIEEKTIHALGRLGDFTPYRLEPPYTIEIDFFDETSAEKAAGIGKVSLREERGIRMEGDDLPLLWESFLSAYTA
jgi:D-amino peptidase